MVIEPDFDANFVTSSHWAEQPLAEQLIAAPALLFALSLLELHYARYKKRKRKNTQLHLADCRDNNR